MSIRLFIQSEVPICKWHYLLTRTVSRSPLNLSSNALTLQVCLPGDSKSSQGDNKEKLLQLVTLKVSPCAYLFVFLITLMCMSFAPFLAGLFSIDWIWWCFLWPQYESCVLAVCTWTFIVAAGPCALILTQRLLMRCLGFTPWSSDLLLSLCQCHTLLEIIPTYCFKIR